MARIWVPGYKRGGGRVKGYWRNTGGASELSRTLKGEGERRKDEFETHKKKVEVFGGEFDPPRSPTSKKQGSSMLIRQRNQVKLAAMKKSKTRRK
jgi:hypothetical protein